MEDHGGHPLLHGGHQQLQHGGAAATLAYASWDYTPGGGAPFEDQDAAGAEQLADSCAAFATAAELRRALVRALDELHASRAAHEAELRRVESEAARLAALVSSAAAERDELRRHCHSLLLLLHHQAQAQAAAPPAPSPTSLLHAGGALLHAAGGGGVGSAAAGTSETAAPGSAADDAAELEMALARRLPEKGRLVEAVVSAGPLLQTLLLAGPLPRWRHPPPPAPADIIPPFHPGLQHKAGDAASNSFSSASASAGSSSPESNCSGGPPPPTVAHALPSFHMSPTSFCM